MNLNIIKLNEYKKIVVLGERKFFDLFVYLLIFIISIYIGARDLSIGADTNNYFYAYNNGFSDRIEPVFIYLYAFFDFLGLSFSLFISVPIFFLMVGVYQFSIRLVGCRFKALFILLLSIMTPFYFALTTNVLRQCLAVGFFLIGISSKNKLTLITFFILSFLSHKASIILTLSYLITYCNFVTVRYLFATYILVVILAYIGVSEKVLGLIDIFGQNSLYSLAETARYETGFRIDFILFNLLPFITYFILLKNKLLIYSFHRFSLFLIIGSIIHTTFIFMPFSDRIALPYWFLYPLVLFQFIDKKKLIILAGAPLSIFFVFCLLIYIL